MTKKTEIENLNVYLNNEFVGKIENDIEIIAQLVASATPYDNYKIVDFFDELVLSTIGCFLGTVKDMTFRNRLMNVLVPLQMGGEEIEPVKYLK